MIWRSAKGNANAWFLRALTGLALVAGLSACVTPVTQVQTRSNPQSRLHILAPGPDFDPPYLPDGWVIIGDPEPTVTRVVRQGIPAARVEQGGKSFALARRLWARLLVTPYLSWSWHMGPSDAPVHPVSLLVGFHGGSPATPAIDTKTLPQVQGQLPAHDRLLRLVWSAKPLARGTLINSPRIPRYIVRGGKDNADQWWLENVDLMGLYGRLWPTDRIARTHISFVGITAAGGGDKTAGLFSGVLLSR